LDLAVVNHDDNNISILLGNGDGKFGNTTTHSAGVASSCVITGDFNKDSKRDLAVANIDNNIGLDRAVTDDGYGSISIHFNSFS
jgi:hypothetical protein